MKFSEYSAVIIGSGAAGLYSALKISQMANIPNKILVVTKDSLGISNSKYAQGGIVGVLHQNPEDNIESHIKDTINAGAGICNIDAVTNISKASDAVINDLINIGVVFDRNDKNELTFTLEAAHSIRRILHSGGDATGKGIIDGLIKAVNKDDNISVLENSVAVEILVNTNNECNGVIIYNKTTNEHEVIYTQNLILASGGAGQIYKYTTNPKCATGDGIALAYEVGCDIQDMEFIQFHPTALALSTDSKNRFLISEAVRGEGAKLLNNKNEEFMSKYSEKRELAPRDVVARAIYNEMQKENSSNVYLDATVIGAAKLTQRFPTISKNCQNNGINITEKPIPVAPAAHYTMGGIKADIYGKTSVNGLFAIGETASTGFHGANRLASNSLLECVVCGYKLADCLAHTEIKQIIPDDKVQNTINLYSQPVSEQLSDIAELKSEMQDIMWNKVGIIRTKESLIEAKNELSRLKNKFGRNRVCTNCEEYELRNMLTVASLITECALNRKESRGAHYRTDYPQTDKDGIHSVINKTTKKDMALC